MRFGSSRLNHIRGRSRTHHGRKEPLFAFPPSAAPPLGSAGRSRPAPAPLASVRYYFFVFFSGVVRRGFAQVFDVPVIQRAETMAMQHGSYQNPLVCHGHSRPIVELDYSRATEDGVFLISASKGASPTLSGGLDGALLMSSVAANGCPAARALPLLRSNVFSSAHQAVSSERGRSMMSQACVS